MRTRVQHTRVALSVAAIRGLSGRSWITAQQSRQSDLVMLLGKPAGLWVEIDVDVLIDTFAPGGFFSGMQASARCPCSTAGEVADQKGSG